MAALLRAARRVVRGGATVLRISRGCSTGRLPLPPTTVVQDRATAARVADQLRSMAGRIFACDTEVADIDVKKQSPCGNGRVICASVYAGPDVDFGNGPRLFIDNWGDAEVGTPARTPESTVISPRVGASQGVLSVFREFFESEAHRKVRCSGGAH